MTNTSRKKVVAILAERHALLLGYIAAGVTILVAQTIWDWVS